MVRVERHVQTHPLPKPYEAELLVNLIEECAEVQQCATKMLRFGVEESQPGQPYDNRQRLGYEVGNLEVLLHDCKTAGLFDLDSINLGFESKVRKLRKYLKHRPQSVAEMDRWDRDQNCNAQ